MKKFLLVLFNLILVVATGGLWLLPLLIFILVRRSNKNKPNNLPTSVAVSADKSSLSGAARESLFNDATKQAIKDNWKLIAALGSATVLLVASANFAMNFLDNRESNQIFSEAQELIDKDDFNGAKSRINAALVANPSATQRANALRNQVAGLEDSLKFLAEANNSIAKNELLAAAEALRKVISDERGLRNKAEQQLVQIEERTRAQVAEQVTKLKSAQKYKEAFELLQTFSRAYPNNSTFVEQASELSDLRERQEESRKKIALSRLKKTYDEFQDVTWYQSPSSPRYRNSNAFYIYFGIDNGSKLPLRLVMQYYSSDWLFIEEAKINVDGKIYTVTSTDWERDNDSDIWEWSDEPLNDRELIEAIVKSKSAVIRYEGRQYYDNRTISSSQKLALKQVLEAYDAL